MVIRAMGSCIMVFAKGMFVESIKPAFIKLPVPDIIVKAMKGLLLMAISGAKIPVSSGVL